MKVDQTAPQGDALPDGYDLNLLLVRERNVDGCGDFADVLVLLDQPATPAQRAALQAELIRLRAAMDCPDTDEVVQAGLRNVLGDAACWAGYQLIEF